MGYKINKIIKRTRNGWKYIICYLKIYGLEFIFYFDAPGLRQVSPHNDASLGAGENRMPEEANKKETCLAMQTTALTAWPNKLLNIFVLGMNISQS